MIGYKYTTEQEAINSREEIDAYYGIPVTPYDVTKNWVDYQIASLDIPIFYYIVYDESLEVVLGLPQDFIVSENPLI